LLGKKKNKKKIEKIEPYFKAYTGIDTDTTSATTTNITMVMTDDGYDYVTIRTLITKLNEIIDNISEEK